MPPKKRRASSAPKPPKPPKAPQAWESYSQTFQATQYTHDSLSAVVIQPPEASVASVAIQQAVVLIEDIKEAWPSSQREDIEDELGAVFEARGETAEDEADEADETELPELLAKEVTRMGLPAVPTSWEPMAAVPELDLEVINLPDELIFAAWRAGEPIGGVNVDVKSDEFPDQDEDSECFAYCTL